MKKNVKTGLAFAIATVIILSVTVNAGSPTPTDYDDYLINSLVDENVGIRASAAQLLGERKVTRAIEPLVQMLQHDREACARIVAAMALFQIANENVIPVLKERIKKDNNKTVRRVLTGIVHEMEQKYLVKLEIQPDRMVN